MTPHDAFARWKAVLAQEDEAWEMDEAALVYAAAEYPDLRIDEEQAKIDRLAERIRADLPDGPGSEATLCRRLFEIEGYLGNREEYDHPRNSYLNEVLDCKLGIPITLSVLAMAVGRRAGVDLRGVGMPGHFLLRAADRPLFFDPFAGGRPVAIEECRRRFDSIYAGSIAWSDAYLDPTPKRQILARMLNNLKQSYITRSDFPRARRIVEWSLALAPDSTQDRRLLIQIQEWQARLN